MSATLPHKIDNPAIVEKFKTISQVKDCVMCGYVAVTKEGMWEQCQWCGYVYHKSILEAINIEPKNSTPLRIKPEPIIPIISRYVTQNHKPLEKKKIVFGGVVLLTISFIITMLVL